MSIKNAIKKMGRPVVRSVLPNDRAWKAISFFLRFGGWLRFERSKYEHARSEERLKKFFSDRIVRSGFFKGMKYNSFDSVGSSIFPKLLGSYEAELHPVLESFKKNKYQQIIDVGCAEGYYAVGLAVRFPEAKVHAFDIDQEALQLCEALAAYNGVSDQLILGAACTPATITGFIFTGKSLLICDCEGYERELFTTANSACLQNTDLIIELHPFFAPGVKQYLLQLFASTHHCEFISSLDNNRKISEFKTMLQGLDAFDQIKAVEEGRPATMDWLIATVAT